MATYKGHFEDSSGNLILPIPSGAASNIETGPNASQGYTKGSILYFNNKLCKTTQAIANGAALAIGTNLTQINLGTEFSSHMVASNGTEFSFQTLKDGGYN